MIKEHNSLLPAELLAIRFWIFVFITLIASAITVPHSASAQDEWLYSDTAELKVIVESRLEAHPTATEYQFQGMTINLSFLPKNTERQVTSIRYDPMPTSVGDEAIFETKNIGEYTIRYTADVKTQDNSAKVKNKILFPLDPKSVPDSIREYLAPAKRIDSDNIDIIRAASRIAEGEDDAYIVVDKISGFVNREVTYNLSTLFIKGTKDASWVLRNKEGVCSEITVLFIAMLRSIGIPARFVAGISYTNSPLFTQSFGPHAWAEVYFPGVGWVPYDITYGEFGYIDLGHIEMRKTADASETSTTYSWKARNVDVNADEIRISGETVKTSDNRVDDIAIDPQPYYASVGFLSYNIIKVKIRNLRNYYVSKKIRIGKTQDLEFFGVDGQIVLKPAEEKELYFVVKTPHLDEGYVYTFPITIYTEQNESADTSFRASGQGLVLGESRMQDIMSELRKDILSEKKLAKKVSFSCFKRDYYIDEVINLKCDCANIGNHFFENLSACVGNECKTIELGIGRQERLNFTIIPENTGVSRASVKLSDKDFSETDLIEFRIMDKPKISIVETENPVNASFEDEFDITYTIRKESESDPKKITSEIEINKERRVIKIGELKDKFKISTHVKGSDLTEVSRITYRTMYEDNLGRKYTEEKEVTIRLNPLTLGQRLKVTWNSIISLINNIFA